MRSDCISHPAKERILIIREWQIEFCKGDQVAAALLSFFEYWHSIKLAAGVELYQYHTEDQLVEGILGLGDRERIRCAINFLELTKCITIQGSPDSCFLFHPEVLTEYIFERTAKKSLHPLSGVNPVRIEQSINSRNNELPDHAITYPAMLSSVQKTEDRFHCDRNYVLKVQKFIETWNQNKPKNWLVAGDRGILKTQLTTAMKRHEGTVKELEQDLLSAIAYGKTTKEGQKPLTALDLCSYGFSKLAEWSAKWEAEHQPIDSEGDNFDDEGDNWMDEIEKIYKKEG